MSVSQEIRRLVQLNRKKCIKGRDMKVMKHRPVGEQLKEKHEIESYVSFLLKSPLYSFHFLPSSLGPSKNTKADDLASLSVSKRSLCLQVKALPSYNESTF